MARIKIDTAATDTKLTAKPNVVTIPFWHCNNNVYSHRFLSDIINNTYK